MKLYLCEVLGDDSGNRLRSWITALNSNCWGLKWGLRRDRKKRLQSGQENFGSEEDMLIILIWVYTYINTY